MEIEVGPILEQASQKAKGESLEAALEFLGPYEKQARQAADLANSTKLLEAFVNLCYTSGNWDALNDQIVHLSKKRGQLKQAITSMIQRAMTFVDTQPDQGKKVTLIDTLRKVTLGKIYVEVERARLSKMVSLMREKEGNLKEAADVLFELQVETYGSMSIGEKLDFLLDQMRLGLAIQDHSKTQIISRKINVKFFDGGPDMDDRRIKYHETMIQLALHDQHYLDCAKNYLHLLEIKSIEERRLQLLRYVVVFVILSPYDNEQSDLVNRVLTMKLLEELPLYKSLLSAFERKEIMRWPSVEGHYKHELISATSWVFDPATEAGLSRYAEFKDRVIEHNLRVISTYYSCLRLDRLTTLLDVDLNVAEETLSKLVVNKTIFAKLDRPNSIVTFTPRKDPDTILDEWSHQLSSILDQVVKINHLISKEEMVHSLKQGDKATA